MKAPDRYPEKDFRDAVKNHFDSPGELYRITEAYCLVGQFDEACQLYDRILTLNPGWIDVLDPYARGLFAAHRYQESRQKWQLFLDARKETYKKLGIPENFYTVDDVFISSYGNFTHYYPMDQLGYLKPDDRFYYHVTPTSDGRRSDLGARRNPISNRAMYNSVFDRLRGGVPAELAPLLAQDDYVTRLPYYCATDLKRRPTHHHAAYAEKMIKLCRAGRAAQLRYSQGELDDVERRLRVMGVDLKRPIVCLHARESGYWGRTGDPTHSTKNADIMSFVPAIRFLIDNGYQVVRLGDPSMKRLSDMPSVFDYAHSPERDDYVDLYLLKNAAFLMCTSSGPFTVASMFGTPVLMTNWVTPHILPFLPRDIILMKNFRRRDSGKPMSFEDALTLDYGEFGYYNFQRKNVAVADNTADEILAATMEMLERIEGDAANSEPMAAMRKLLFGRSRHQTPSARYPGREIVSEAKFARGSLGDG
ncbi:MAG: TIGR04372 family glycosyltransferase [Xanthobacteraceae bacterium]